MGSVLNKLATGAFLTRERIRVWASFFLAGFAIAIAWLFATAHGLNDYAGRPLGTDFSDIHAAGMAALHGDAAAPFDILKQQKLEQAIFGATTPLYGWHYPPFFLLVAAPLAKHPHVAFPDCLAARHPGALFDHRARALLGRGRRAPPGARSNTGFAGRRWDLPRSSSTCPRP